MNMKKKALDTQWGERFALIAHYKPTDSQICSAFNTTPVQLQVARELQQSGNFSSVDINVDEYVGLFTATESDNIVGDGATIYTNPKSTKPSVTPPLTANNTSAKRGRKTNNIAKAFLDIPHDPVDVRVFATSHSVSLPVLRQSKRFDRSGLIGSVKVKKDKDSKILMIWRERS